MTTEKRVRYSVDGVRQILDAMEMTGNIESYYVLSSESDPSYPGGVVGINTLEGNEYVFSLDWFREDLTKIDTLNRPLDFDGLYVSLFLSKRISELFSVMWSRYTEREV